jgi:hypothetical protein
MIDVMATGSGGLTDAETAAGAVTGANINLTSSAGHLETGVESVSSAAGLTQQLAELIVGLGELAATIPPLSIQDCVEAHVQSPGGGTAARSGRERDVVPTPPFSLVRGFQLTQTLINLYQRFQRTSIRSQLPCRDLASFGLPSTQVIDDHFASCDTARLDHASILLLFSCHHRVIDVWELVFSHVKKRIERGNYPDDGSGEPSPCERLRIGSFTPSTKIPLEIVLAIEFQAELLSQIRDLVDQIVPSSRPIQNGAAGCLNDKASEIDVRDANIEATENAGVALISRASGLVKQATCVRQSILERVDKNTSDTA